MRADMTKKYTLAMRRNCSHRDLGNQEKTEYLVVEISLDKPLWLVIPTCYKVWMDENRFAYNFIYNQNMYEDRYNQRK